MLPRLPSLASLGLAHAQVGCVANEGRERYLIEAQSTTGFVAWRNAEGQPLVSQSIMTSIRPSRFLLFWSCAGFKDTTPAGEITFLDCHGNSLTRLDVTRLTDLQYLDASFNRLTKLSLDGLTLLEALDVENNQLTTLEVRKLRSLRALNCGANRLTKLDLSGMKHLELLECAGNPLSALKLTGCPSLQRPTVSGH